MREKTQIFWKSVYVIILIVIFMLLFMLLLKWCLNKLKWLFRNNSQRDVTQTSNIPQHNPLFKFRWELTQVRDLIRKMCADEELLKKSIQFQFSSFSKQFADDMLYKKSSTLDKTFAFMTSRQISADEKFEQIYSTTETLKREFLNFKDRFLILLNSLKRHEETTAEFTSSSMKDLSQSEENVMDMDNQTEDLLFQDRNFLDFLVSVKDSFVKLNCERRKKGNKMLKIILTCIEQNRDIIRKDLARLLEVFQYHITEGERRFSMLFQAQEAERNLQETLRRLDQQHLEIAAINNALKSFSQKFNYISQRSRLEQDWTKYDKASERLKDAQINLRNVASKVNTVTKVPLEEIAKLEGILETFSHLVKDEKFTFDIHAIALNELSALPLNQLKELNEKLDHLSEMFTNRSKEEYWMLKSSVNLDIVFDLVSSVADACTHLISQLSDCEIAYKNCLNNTDCDAQRNHEEENSPQVGKEEWNINNIVDKKAGNVQESEEENIRIGDNFLENATKLFYFMRNQNREAINGSQNSLAETDSTPAIRFSNENPQGKECEEWETIASETSLGGISSRKYVLSPTETDIGSETSLGGIPSRKSVPSPTESDIFYPQENETEDWETIASQTTLSGECIRQTRSHNKSYHQYRSIFSNPVLRY